MLLVDSEQMDVEALRVYAVLCATKWLPDTSLAYPQQLVHYSSS